ncbi:hypothetical protein [Paenibacillus sp. FSL L8-0506]|uniref:hypothetical protein n=1 Tax=Paenibacillus sp. FSL L8-0506 TaxID=2975335 RepID=UPI0030F791F4
MTALNFVFSEQVIFIAMDTLSTSSNDRTPYKFASKIFPLPHLRGVMCGTGNIDLILDWYRTIQKNIVAQNIDYFAENSSDILLKLNENYPEYATTTIYQFGYSESVGKFRGFVFRSTNDFKQEELNYCIAQKPQVNFNFDNFEENIDENLVDLMMLQKLEDDQKLDKVGIGGEIHRMILTKHASRIDIIHRFSDFELQYEQMLKNLSM